ncbi:hypothetical protein [Mycobacterium lepromatosis]|uniref:hypothetical protein n=1 Tax=Mycobacterium lepromatosis TaxID=480418 RepID=UPI0005F81064|nr:hypothetical protein [Mycobacterium lepromatosis]
MLDSKPVVIAGPVRHPSVWWRRRRRGRDPQRASTDAYRNGARARSPGAPELAGSGDWAAGDAIASPPHTPLIHLDLPE